MYAKYKDQVEFLLVYIREAHPTDGWVHPLNEQDGILLHSAQDQEQKTEYATTCVRNLGIKFTAVVDRMDYQVESNYSGWPDRLYLVSKEGHIVWKGDPGPVGFRAEELQAAIQKELSPHRNS